MHYTHNHRTLKWWKRLFVIILDICLLNATIVYNSIPTNSRLSGLEFRVKVIEGLLSTWKYNPAQHANQLSCSRPSSQHPHFPGRSGKKRNCVVCSTKFKRRQTRMICKREISLREISQPMIQVYSPCNLCPPSPPPPPSSMLDAPSTQLNTEEGGGGGGVALHL